MADKLFKVGEVIELGYQAPNKESGLTGINAPIAEIFLPSKVKDSAFPDVALVEIGNTGTYRGTFTPDQEGTWQVILHKADGEGQVTKAYSVGAKNIQDIYTDTAKDSTVAKDATVAKDSTVAKDATVAKSTEVATSESNVRGPDNDTLKTLSDQIDSVDTKVSGLDTPAQGF